MPRAKGMTVSVNTCLITFIKDDGMDKEKLKSIFKYIEII